MIRSLAFTRIFTLRVNDCCSPQMLHNSASTQASDTEANSVANTHDSHHALISQTLKLCNWPTSYFVRVPVYLSDRVLVPARPVFFAPTQDTLPCFADYSLAGIVDDLTALVSLTLFPVPECSSNDGLARRTKTLFAPEQMP